jgi:hypothetical protein
MDTNTAGVIIILGFMGFVLAVCRLMVWWDIHS